MAISIDKVRNIPERYRLAVLSIYFGERTKNESCRMFGINEKTIDKLLFELDPNTSFEKIFHQEVHELLDYCNEVWGTNFESYTDLNQIESVWKSRIYTNEQICQVVKAKAKDWKNTDYEKYLRPQTIFNPEKFKNYYEEQIKKTQNNGISKIISVTQSVLKDWGMD